MRLPNKGIFLSGILAVFATSLQGARLDEERVLGYLFDQWKNNPPGATSVLLATDAAIPRLSIGPIRATVYALRALNFLENEQIADAQATLETLRTFPDLSPAVDEWCKRWLTRLDRERVRDALKAFYRKEVRFPDSLAPLQSLIPPPPLTDRWGTPWRYQVVPLKRIRGAEAQSYVLESVSLGRLSDLTAARSQLRPDRPSIRPIGLVPQPGQRAPLIRFETTRTPGEQAILSERSSWKGVALLYVGDSILILVENDFFFVLRRPES